MNKSTLLIGAPGTGKTYQLVQEILQRQPEKFALVSFTRRAANEAKQRLKEHYDVNQLKYVRTIHSLCFELLNLKKSQVVQWSHIKQFGMEYGYEFTGRHRAMEEDTQWNFTEDDIEFRQMMIDHNRMQTETKIYNIDMWKRWELFKYTNKLIDFNDMIIKCLDIKLPEFDLVCVDEVQDLSPLQLDFINKLSLQSKETIYAGDDNQMIFEWAGVDRQRFLNLSKDCELKQLTKNYRITGAIENLSNKVIHRQTNKVLFYTYNTRHQENGNIEYISNIFDIDTHSSTLILARNGYLLRNIIDQLEDWGFAWSWLDDEYKNTKIKIGTIHASKGSEADNVVLLSDVSPATYEHIDEDSEHRVWYVGITRAKYKLYIVQPNTDYSYDLS